MMEVSGAVFSELVPDPLVLPPGLMFSALASCHSLALLGGQALGDPLELKMIESTGMVMAGFSQCFMFLKRCKFFPYLFTFMSFQTCMISKCLFFVRTLDINCN